MSSLPTVNPVQATVPKASGARIRTVLAPTHSVTCLELEAINTVVAQAILAWDLPTRVRRLALPSLVYSPVDLKYMHVAIADESDGSVVGVAVWEEADRHDAPDEMRAVLLHGLFVLPTRQRQGIGTSLLEVVEDWARTCDFGAIVLRAWRESEVYFRARGFCVLDKTSAVQQFPIRLGKYMR